MIYHNYNIIIWRDDIANLPQEGSEERQEAGAAPGRFSPRHGLRAPQVAGEDPEEQRRGDEPKGQEGQRGQLPAHVPHRQHADRRHGLRT